MLHVLSHHRLILFMMSLALLAAPVPSYSVHAHDPNLVIKSGSSEAGLSQELNSQLESEILSLSRTQDLTMNDYFVTYLIKQSSEDAAELMSAYPQNMLQTRPSTLKISPRAGFSK
jgi:hypothetical protein